MKKINWFTTIIILGILLRLVLAVSTYHSDLGAFALAGKYIVGENRWLTFYDAIASKDSTGKMIIHRDDMVFNYQPLAYIIPAVVYLPFRDTIASTGEKLINRNWVEANKSSFQPILLLYKLPMILADLYLLWLIPKFFKKNKSKQLAVVLWTLNPLAIYVSSMMGQVDIIIAALITTGLYFLKSRRYYSASIVIALSALIKPIGLILIPLLGISLLSQRVGLKKSLAVPLLGFAIYLLGIIPFIGSVSYRYFALFAEQINKSTHASISIASGTDIPYFFILLITIVLLLFYRRFSLRYSLGVALLSSLAFTHFHPQWLVWLMPWLIIYSVGKRDLFGYFILIACWLAVLFSFDTTLQLQMFIHSKLSLPLQLTNSTLFTEVVQLARAGIVALLIKMTFI